RPNKAVVDLGYRGVDADNPGLTITHRGKARSLSAEDRKLLKRRNAIEPIFGHLKADHRMDRCHLKGEIGDRLHAVLCAAGYNLRWLLRMIAKKGLRAILWLLPAQVRRSVERALAVLSAENRLPNDAMLARTSLI
ncbi:MAG: transposase, partial [Rubrivivax sp.]